MMAMDRKFSYDQHLLLGYAFLSIALNLLPLPLSETFLGQWNDIAWTLCSLAVAIKSVQTALLCRGNSRFAWLLIALSCLSWFLGMLYWDNFHLLEGVYPPYPGLADIGYILMGPLISLAIIHFRQELLGLEFIVYQSMRFLLVFLSLLLIHLLLYSNLLTNTELSVAYVITSLSYPLVFFSTVIFALTDIWYRYDARSQQVILLIISGVALLAFANAEYAYALLAQDYYSSPLVDIAWAVGFVPLYFAGVVQSQTEKTRFKPILARLSLLSELGNKAFLPLMLGMVAITLILQRKPISHELSPGFTLVMGLFAMVMIGYLWIAERKERIFQDQLYAKDLMLNSLVETIPNGILECDLAGNISYSNQALNSLFGTSQDALSQRRFWQLFSEPDVQTQLQSLFKRIPVAHPMLNGFVSSGIRDDGETIILKVDWNYRHNTYGAVNSIVAVFSDITREKCYEDQLRQAAQVFASTTDAVIIADREARIIQVNTAFQETSGFAAQASIGLKTDHFFADQHGRTFFQSIWQTLEQQGKWSGEIWNRKADGDDYPTWSRISSVSDEQGKLVNIVWVFSDISDLKQQQQHLEHIAHYDSLTQLPNRLLLSDRLLLAMVQEQRRDKHLAVAYLDLDGFKGINDAHGHETGDILLKILAERLKETLREGDTIARLGGDEFVAVLIDLNAHSESIPLLERILGKIVQPAHVDGKLLQVSASLGVTFYPQPDPLDADQLLRQADQAMYQAKQAGKNCYHIFDAEQERSIRGRIENLERIRTGLAHREFTLHYQPKVNMRTGKVIGAEALVRWQHPESGLLQPAQFLPVIENTPLAIELDNWVIRTALTQLQAWHASGLPLVISINVCAINLQRTDFVERLQALLDEFDGLDWGQIELEVLETSALEDIAHVARVIEECRELGVHFSLDDFGTGYSSLAYLKRLPAETLKIDRSFVRDLLDEPEDFAILQGILGLANSFGRVAIAEGVETVAHGVMLLHLGCELAQGYGIARPMPAAQLPDWMTNWVADPAWAACRPLHRDELPLLHAMVDHRAWVAAIEKGITQGKATPSLDSSRCRFGQWLNAKGRKTIDDETLYQATVAIHEQVHQVATRLLMLANDDKQEQSEPLTRELHALSDRLIAILTRII
jgi:diguanylate cyclase (GGDEF)-like protein/PAS domain S-box-containing protein